MKNLVSIASALLLACLTLFPVISSAHGHRSENSYQRMAQGCRSNDRECIGRMIERRNRDHERLRSQSRRQKQEGQRRHIEDIRRRHTEGESQRQQERERREALRRQRAEDQRRWYAEQERERLKQEKDKWRYEQEQIQATIEKENILQLEAEQIRNQREQEEAVRRQSEQRIQAELEQQRAQEELSRQRFQADQKQQAQEVDRQQRIVNERNRRLITPAGQFQPQGRAQQATTSIRSPGHLSKAEVKSLQFQLKNAGFDPGPLDGMMGPRTQRALSGYIKRYGLPATKAAGASQ